MTTLVTGASGFLGWHIARVLQERGRNVRALIRPNSKIVGLDLETVTGDLRDDESLHRAAAGCSVVYHAAADYRLWAKDSGELYRSNVDGTRNLIVAAKRAGVSRFIYTSTVGCIHPPDETRPVSLEDMSGAYKRSKFLAEQVALDERELPIVIVNPTAPIGDHDVKPTPTGRIILDFLKGDMPAYIDTGLNLVDVRDVALGHVLAEEKGQHGERYILGCENLTLQQILSRLAALTGKPAPRVRLPYAVAYAAGVVSTAWAHVSGTPPRAPLDAVKMARKKMFVSHLKAERELGFSPAPVDAALSRAIDWFRANGYC
ncbi:MAG: NAD-dependent epimerase/dehydratase [Bryobacterales bacterium]|nr:NAD-dependent epimerase/dehydratase [Bryobacterales bacterium]